MKDEIKVQQIKKTIDESLLNSPISTLSKEENEKFIFEQYKLIVDSSHKIEERRNGSNNIFIAMNSIFATILTQIVPLPNVRFEKLVFLCLLLSIGMVICWDWLRTIGSYKKINYVNYSLIKALEKILPASVFSLRADIVDASDAAPAKANTILKKETLLPIVFISVYLIYFVFICVLLISY